jgi:hypothetical protein
MTTYVKTTTGNRYEVETIENGKLVVRQPSGKRRLLSVKNVGRARYEAALAHFYRR